MKRLLMPWCFGLLAFAQETPFSGPQPGEALPSFKMLAVNGPDAGREVDYVAKFGDAPMLIMFAHNAERKVQANLWPCDRFAASRAPSGLKAIFVYLAPDKVAGEALMNHWVRALGMRGTVGVSLEGVEGPGAYGLNKDVAVTALLAKGGKVVANHSYVQPGYHGARDMIAEMVKLVGGEIPAAEDFLYGPGTGNSGRVLPPHSDPNFLYGLAPANKPSGLAGAEPAEAVEALTRVCRADAPESEVLQALQVLKVWAGQDSQRRRYLTWKFGNNPCTPMFAAEKLRELRVQWGR